MKRKDNSVMEFEKLCKIIARVLSVDEREITRTTTFVNDLGADSLDVAQIILEVKEEFMVDIKEEQIKDIVTVGDAENAMKGIVK